MFLLKKILSPLFFPFSLCLGLFLLALLFLFFTQRQRVAKRLFLFTFFLLLVFSFEPVADRLLYPLEYRYSPVTEYQIVRSVDTKWIVILGGGSRNDPEFPANSRLSDSSLARLMEGIRLYRMLPGCKLLLSGAGIFAETSNAKEMADTAIQLGIPSADLVLEERSRDTAEQAMEIQKIVKKEKFFLVTSASHLPRAMALFEKRGMRPIPAPTQFLVRRGRHHGPHRYYPGPAGLAKTERAFYEYIGIVWGTITGKI